MEVGFYLTDAGRSACPQMLTTCFAKTLLGLRMISKMDAMVAKSVENDSEIYHMLRFVMGFVPFVG